MVSPSSKSSFFVCVDEGLVAVADDDIEESLVLIFEVLDVMVACSDESLELGVTPKELLVSLAEDVETFVMDL